MNKKKKAEISAFYDLYKKEKGDKMEITEELAKIENIDTKKMTADVRKVNLSIPKFDFEYDLDLAKKITSMRSIFRRGERSGYSFSSLPCQVARWSSSCGYGSCWPYK